RTERVFPPPSGGSLLDRLARLISKDDGASSAVQPALAMQARVSDLVGQLLANAEEEVADNCVVTVSSFVNANQLYATSALGRFLSEQMITELQKAGVEVVEVRKTPSIMISDPDGVYGLSSDMDQLSFVHNAQTMVVGTYSVAGGQIFINARLLRNRDNVVLSSASLAFAMDDITHAMLADEGMPARPGKPVAIRSFAGRKSAKR
ncbi:MAG: FlgO family outer membrane protein, partial [Desulfobulbaceae bacterium]|nr:FlgO family outer membrane protein [Desulfobulbaceae bacterium]